MSSHGLEWMKPSDPTACVDISFSMRSLADWARHQLSRARRRCSGRRRQMTGSGRHRIGVRIAREGRGACLSQRIRADR